MLPTVVNRMSYIYSALQSPSSIRLLILRRAPKGDSFSLEEVDLDDNPHYEALSYTWQDPDADAIDTHKEATIQMGKSGSLTVTTNLFTILQHLLKALPDQSSQKRIWIDQICINQNDMEERGRQVSIMHRIYGQAGQTLIWLGRPNQNTSVCLDLLRKFGTPALDYTATITTTLLKQLEGRLGEILGHRESVAMGASYSREDYTSAIISLLNRNWFSRAWVIQEAALSPNPLIMHSTETFDLRLLDHLVLAFSKVSRTEGVSLRDLTVLKTTGAATLRHIQTCRQRVLSIVDRRGKLEFLDILQRFALSVKATDPRDHVYAFLAFQDRPLPALKPDYTLSVEMAYAAASAAIMNGSGSLSLLGLVRGSLYPYILPSWAVDWRAAESRQGSRIDQRDGGDFNASCGRIHKADTPYTVGSPVIGVRGKVIDIIKTTSPICRSKFHPDPKSCILLFEEFDYIQDILPEPLSLDSDARTGFAARILAVLVAYNQGPSISNADKELSLNNLLFVYNNLASLETHEEYQENMRYFWDLKNALLHGVALRIKKRLFFATRYESFGLGPSDIRRGDVVCILHGSKVPCILRPMGRQYRVVGQCYYEQWMYGDSVDWQEKNADTLELI